MPILAAACEEVNVDYDLYDFNLWLSTQVDADTWQQIDNNWIKSNPALDSDKEYFKLLLEKIKEYVSIVINGQPNLIAISIFTLWSAYCGLEFIRELNRRPQRDCFKIVIGGTGIDTGLLAINNNKLCEYLLNNQLIDYYISGEGEFSFRKILKGDVTGPGINNLNFEQIDDLDQFPYPSYKKIDPWQYKYINCPDVSINGSRGCVRNCTYCDVANYWPKFKYRSGDKLAEEMYSTWSTTGIQAFEFSDSLINGSLKQFKSLNRRLIELKENNPEFNITYKGQFICRSQGQFTEKDYADMTQAGCNYIYVGVESFSDPVRYAMDKKFDTDALEFHLKMCAKYGIPNVFLMIVGYPTETHADHEHNLQALKKYQVYSQAGVIDMITFGFTTSILKNTPLERMKHELGIQNEFENFNSKQNWISVNNPKLTLKERVRRWIELVDTADQLGYRQPRIDSAVAMLTQSLAETTTKKRIPLTEIS